MQSSTNQSARISMITRKIILMIENRYGFLLYVYYHRNKRLIDPFSISSACPSINPTKVQTIQSTNYDNFIELMSDRYVYYNYYAFRERCLANMV